MTEELHAERQGDVGLITLERPHRRNALTTTLCGEARTAVLGLVADGCRALVLTGAGGHFCSGADLDTVRDAAFRPALFALLDSLWSAPVPVIAAVQGFALGAGTQLAVASDLRVVDATARFGIPAAKLGLAVDHWTMERAALLAGHGPARAMLLGDEQVDGETAVRIGLATRLAEPDGAVAGAVAWAAHLGTLAPLTLAAHKLALNRLERLGPGPLAAAEHPDPIVREADRRAWGSEDLSEGLAAFGEKRSPEFRGR